MKKVLILESSPRKGYCQLISNAIAQQLWGEYELDTVSLRDLDLKPCKGCAACLIAGSSKCPERTDDVIKVMEKMLWADGIIFIVPNYALGVPALLKNLMDRMAYVFHRPRMFHKTCLPVIVQGVIGGKKIAAYVNEVMEYWGMNPVKGAIVTGGVYLNQANLIHLSEKDRQNIDNAVLRFEKQIEKTKKKVPSLLRLLIFRMSRTSIRYGEGALPPDKAYYNKMGWFESDYYYDVPLNPFVKLIGSWSDRFAKQLVLKG